MRPVSLAIITRAGKTYLGKKKTGEIGKGLLNGPGGKREPEDKDMIACAIREAEEELGITLLRDRLAKVAIVMFYAAGEPFFECHVFRTDTFEGEPVETEDMIPMGWFPNDRLPYDQMHQGDRDWFPRAVEGEPFCANYYYLEPGKGLDPDRPVEFLPFADTEIA